MPTFRNYASRVKETATTTGVGNFTLSGAVSQFVSVSSRVPVGGSFPYAIVGQTGTEWEIGFGTLLTASTFSRDTVIESSNADALVNFSAGTKDVFLTIPPTIIHDILTLGQGLAARSGMAMP